MEKNIAKNVFMELIKINEKKKIAELLHTSPKALREFEEKYRKEILDKEEMIPGQNFFELNAKTAAKQNKEISAQTEEEITREDIERMLDISERIVTELVNQTTVWSFDGHACHTEKCLATVPERPVTAEEIMALPKSIRPQLAGNLICRDIGEESYKSLLMFYLASKKEKSPNKRVMMYQHFRWGLDILDLDAITYEMLGMNPISMGYWLPKMVPAVMEQGFFQIPKTTIIKVPITMLQLTRLEYTSLNRVTLEIINAACRQVFQLDEMKEYFVKTGTFSSKFDFRNAHVKGPKEVREIGEYLTFIQNYACCMAMPTNNRRFYGVSTTNEWVVREYIPDEENAPCIYKGMPLHTEYRVFVDFDTKEVLSIHPYWDPEVMKKRFGHEEDADSPHQIHDYIIYCSHEETLMRRYNDNKDMITEKIQEIIPCVEGLSGQWSIDIMQNGDTFWLIDMALAENSAFYECVPMESRRPSTENWIPMIPELMGDTKE